MHAQIVSSVLPSGVTLGLLGLLLFGIAVGVLWGTIRGAKRSAFRLATLVVFLLIAFFITPLVARLFVNIRVIDGRSVGEFIDYRTSHDENFSSLMYNVPTLGGVIDALAVALMSLVVFIGLVVLFRFLSWIAYVIFVRKIAPKNVMVDGGLQPAKRHRLAGAGIGLVQGVILFMFLMIPINGVIRTMNQIDNYNPSFAASSVAVSSRLDENGYEEEGFDLGEIFYELRLINNDIQSSGYGVITRWTGIQLLSGPMLGYLTRIRTNDVNISLRRDVINGAQLAKDVLAIQAMFFDEDGERLDFADAMLNMPNGYFVGAQNAVRRLFDIEIFNFVLNSIPGIVDFIDGRGFLDDFDILDTEDPQVSQDFNDELLGALREFNARTIRNDIIGIIEALRILFNQTAPGSNVTLFEGFRDVINSFNQGGQELETATTQLSVALGTNVEESPAFAFFRQIFGLSIFQNVLTEERRDLIEIPLLNIDGVDLREEEIDFELNWGTSSNPHVARGITEVLINLSNALPGVSRITQSDHPIDAIADMNDLTLDSVGNILNMLTHPDGFAISTQIRSILYRYITENVLDGLDDGQGGAPFGGTVKKVVEDLLDLLSNSPEDIDWKVQLRTVRAAVSLVGQIQNFDPNNIGDVLDLVFDNEFLQALRDDPVLGPLLISEIENTLNAQLQDITGDTFVLIEFSNDHKEVIDAILLISGGLSDVIKVLADGDGMDPEDIIGALDENRANLLAVANSGALIFNVHQDVASDFGDTIDNTFGTQAERDAIRKLFGLGGN